MQELLLSDVSKIDYKLHVIPLDGLYDMDGRVRTIVVPETFYKGVNDTGVEKEFSLRHIVRSGLPEGCKVELQVADEPSIGRGEVDLGEGLRSILSYKVISDP